MLYKFRRFCASPTYLSVPFLIAVIGVVGGEKALLPSMILNVQLIAAILFFCDDMFPAFLPVFCVITLGATNLSSLTDFVPYIPVAFTVVAGLIFHLIRYRRPIYIGKSLYGLVATSIAVLLSGLGTPISSRDFTSLGAIYHIIGLSVGLILLYFLFASNRREDRAYDPINYFLWSMWFLGLLCSVVIIVEFSEWILSNRGEGWEFLRKNANDFFIAFSYRNTITTLLVMCLPTAFYLAKKVTGSLLQMFYFASGTFMYLSALLSCARTAIVFGTLLILICLIYYHHNNRFTVAKWTNILLSLGVVTGIIVLVWLPLSAFLDFRLQNGFIDPEEARVKFLFRSVKDFLAHPLFGIGISSTANTDIYSAPGCISWYHMYFPQLWGSMGLVGFGAYMYQLFIRAKLILTKPTAQSIAMGLVYLGLFLYSQTDPGEFAPIPYAVITVLMFVLLEDRLKKPNADNTVSQT